MKTKLSPKKRKFLKQVVVALSAWAILAVGATANAGNVKLKGKGVTGDITGVTNTSQGDNNGKPFTELNALIKENRALIEANQYEIANLKADVSSINSRIDSIEIDLDNVSSQVETNMANIRTAFLQIAEARGNIASLQSELSALRDRYQKDMQNIENTLVAIDGRLSFLSEESAALADALNAKVAELRVEINNNAVGIDSLLVDVALINAELTSINTNYNLLRSKQDTLNDRMDAYGDQLANLEIALNELKSGMNSRVSDPCVTAISIGDSLMGELVNDGRCTSDSRNGGGVVAGQYYTFTLPSSSSVVIEMDGSQCSTGTLSDPYMYLHSGGRSGPVIAYNDDSSRSCGWTRNSRIEKTLQPGTYTIEATSYSSGQYGTFHVSVR